MTVQTKLYNILKSYAFFNQDEYEDYNEFLFETNSLEIIRMGMNKLIDYEIPTPKDVDDFDFKQYFLMLFGTTFFNDNIAFETEQEFYLKLYGKIMEVLPYYNVKLSLLYNAELKNLYNKESVHSKGSTSSEANNKSQSYNKNANSDFPQKLITADNAFNQQAYLKDGSVSSANGNSNSEASTKAKTDTEIIRGNIFEHINNIKSIGNVYKELLKEFEPLFSNIW